MQIRDCFTDGAPVFSFEFSPPKTPAAEAMLYATIADLAPLRPSFVSVTYGAGGSTRERTVELVGRIQNEIGIEAMAHLTCVGHSRDEIATVLGKLWDQGIRNVLALRGDPPRGQSEFVRPDDGFAYGSELVAFIRAGYDFCIGSAGYPEGHVECPDRAQDLLHLKQKVDAGAEFLITQLFFNADDYFRFVENAKRIGIGVPIVPGIMPVTNVKQLERFTTLCGASIPVGLRARLDGAQDDGSVVQVGIDWATEQCSALLDGGAPGIHFYTLNRSHSTRVVFERLSRRAGEGS